MSDLTKKSNLIYLGIFLCVVCAIATAVMAATAVMTQEPIRQAKSKKVADGLKIVLPDFDNDPLETKQTVDGVNLYTAEKGGKLVGYAAEASSSNGYGGTVNGLVGFEPDGSIRTVIVTGHNETPGLGTKITDRVRQRTFSDIIKGTPVDTSLAPNPILDQFHGRKAASEKWTVKKDGGNVDFISGATISSRAAADFVTKAANAVFKHVKESVPADHGGK